MTELPRLNGIIKAWEQGRPAYASFAHPERQVAIEFSQAPYDGIVFEMEHNAWDPNVLQDCLQYMLNRKQIAALAGLAPFNRDSGSMRVSRCIWGGRAQVRRLLYMATVAGVRSNPTIRTFYLRLRTNGKHAKLALIACMRKFLVILNAMLHDKTHWQTPALTFPASSLSLLLGAVSEHGCC